MDEISTGLDSSTTYQIVNSLRQNIHIFKGTALISLLQPAPETYNLFDDIILLSDSQIVYQGPREDVLDFFESMGFRCPERKGVADFLQEVTSRKDQEQYWICKDEPYSFVTVKEFAEAFQSFHIGRKLGDELATPFDKTKSHPAAMKTEKYGVRKKELLDACIAREYLLMKRNSFVYIFKLTQLTIMAVIGMTIFLRTEMHKNTTEDGNIYTGALFFIVITVMFNGMSELAMTIVKLPVFYKQRGLLFYPAWAYALPSWFLKIPITFVEVGVWVFITYYVIGFDPNVGRLFRQYLLLLLLNQVASSLFRFIAAASRNMIIANTFGTFALLLLFALGGFVLSRENIKKWWIWVYWSSPLMYAQNAIVVNEFLGKSWSKALVEIPCVFSQAVVYGAIVYAMIGFEWTAAKFFWYLFFTFFSQLYFTFFGMMAVAATTNQHIAAIIAVAFYALWNLFSGEMLVGPSKALFMDEISTGLDSSTTYQIVNSLRQTVHILNGTALISLLQPAPETYDLFDDIILLSDSRIIYQGPREDVLNFFESMGFRCPERKGVADFLQEVTSRKDQEQYWAHKDEPYSFVTAKEFAEAFQSFHFGRKLGDELATPFDKTKSHPAALKTEKYGVRKKELLDACISREYLLMKRNSFVYIFKLTQLTIVAMIAMTIFLRTEMHKNTTEDGNIYTGALFFTVMMVMFNGMSELAMTILKLPVFYKQRGLLFYPAWAYALPSWFLKIPITFVEVGVWVFITYYVIGFDPNVGRLFRQYLLLLLLNQTASSLFRFIAAACRSMIVANTFGSFALVLPFALGGIVLSRENVKKWWIWGYWSSPMMYAQNAILVNEFLGKSWSKNASTNSTESLGVAVLKARGFFTEAHWYWIGAGALLGFIFVFNFCYTVALTYLNPFEKPQAVITVESDNAKTEGKIELSSHRKGSIDQTASTESGEEIGRSISSVSSSVRAEAIAEARRNNKKGMVLPFQPLSITFDDIRYSVDMPEEMKSQGVPEDRLELLKGVSGAFRPGVLTALMGVSGAGKTTLMDVLAGRKTGGYIEGSISISGYPKKQETFARISGYCEQNDIHSPHVTVHESLLYSAWLRLPPNVDAETRKVRVFCVVSTFF
ncbi:hypothetical protein VitviT2T_013535 [Vitis vinifera]|uniref:Pleiotropic drug resistance protein 1 n=2 Tax=Vitis vinifera TaxID=29760 RepID=A0ABY9CL70_VITVI|nr:hypothetical protein VitviT2T_013535 [Vitis vinifera]